MDDTVKRTVFPPELDRTGGREVAVPVGSLPKAADLEVHPRLIAGNTGAQPVAAADDPLCVDGEHPSQMTYATRLPPDHPGLQLEKPQARTLRRGPILLIGGALTAAVLLAAAIAFSPNSQQAHPATALESDTQTKGVPVPEAVENAPGNDTDLHPPPPKLGVPLHGTDLPDDQAQPGERRGPSSFGHSSLRETLRDERQKAVGSSILVDIEGSGADNPGGAAANPAVALLAGAGAAAPTKSDSLPQFPQGGAGTGDPNMQQHKSDFLARDGVITATYLNQPVVVPKSPFEVKAGTIIPTTLLTPINSDLPGAIIGQVRENVYDTVSGSYLIIPQGSKLLATYDSAVSYGQERVLLCWNRVVRPDGISLSLECMPGADLAGASGIADEVNHHWWRIVTGVALGTLLSATAERAAGNPTGYQPTIAQGWAANAGGAVNTAGQQITQKNLAIQPTITVRAGYSVNVIVTKDLVFPPYVRP